MDELDTNGPSGLRTSKIGRARRACVLDGQLGSTQTCASGQPLVVEEKTRPHMRTMKPRRTSPHSTQTWSQRSENHSSCIATSFFVGLESMLRRQCFPFWAGNLCVMDCEILLLESFPF